MRIGVVSDTHGHVANARAAVRMLEALEVACVLHCGDIGSAAIVELFAAWPTHFVFGNCDGDQAELAAAIESAGQTCHGEFGSVELAGRRIALLHSDDGRRFARRSPAASGTWCATATRMSRRSIATGRRWPSTPARSTVRIPIRWPSWSWRLWRRRSCRCRSAQSEWRLALLPATHLRMSPAQMTVLSKRRITLFHNVE